MFIWNSFDLSIGNDTHSSVLRNRIQKILNVLFTLMFGLFCAETHFVHMRVVFPQLAYQTALSNDQFVLAFRLVHFLNQNYQFLCPSQSLLTYIVASFQKKCREGRYMHEFLLF